MCQPMFVEQHEEIVQTCQFIVSTSSWLVNVNTSMLCIKD